MQDQINFLKKYPVLNALPEDLLSTLAKSLVVRTYQANEKILTANERVDALYFIKEGSIKIVGVKNTKDDVIAQLGQNQIFGEQALAENGIATANVVAQDKVTVYKIDRENLTQLEIQDPKLIRAFFSLSLASNANKIKQSNTSYIKLLENKIALGNFLVAIIFILLPIGYFSATLGEFNKIAGTSGINSIIAEILGLILFGFAIRVSKLKYSSLGLTWQGGWRAITFGVLYTLPVMALLIVFKYLLIKFHYVPPQALINPTPVIDPTKTFGYSTEVFFAILLGLYVFSAIFQELIVRAGFQAPLMVLLSGSYSNWLAILLPNVFFSMIHLPKSTALAIMVFFPGLLWGWLLYRYKNILAPLASHILLGYFALFVLRIHKIF